MVLFRQAVELIVELTSEYVPVELTFVPIDISQIAPFELRFPPSLNIKFLLLLTELNVPLPFPGSINISVNFQVPINKLLEVSSSFFEQEIKVKIITAKAKIFVFIIFYFLVAIFYFDSCVDITANGFGLGEGGGFSAMNFIIITAVEPCTNVS